EDVDLVGVHSHPLMNATVSDVSDFQCVSIAQLALNAQVPRLRVGQLDIRVKAPRAVREIRVEIQERVGGHWHVSCKRRRIVEKRSGLIDCIQLGVALSQRAAAAKRQRTSLEEACSRGPWVQLSALIVKASGIRRVIPHVLVRLDEIAQRKAATNHRLAATKELAKEPFRILRAPCDTNGWLRQEFPRMVRLSIGHILWVQRAEQRTRIKQISRAGRTVQLRPRNARVSIRQVGVCTRKIPAQPVIDCKARLHSERVLKEESPSLRSFVEIVGLARIAASGILAAFRYIRVLDVYVRDSACKRPVQTLNFAP